MKNYVEELKKAYKYDTIFDLYDRSGKESSPLYPLANYAAMVQMHKSYGAEYDEECKAKGLECIMEHFKCTVYSTNFHIFKYNYKKNEGETLPFSEINRITFGTELKPNGGCKAYEITMPGFVEQYIPWRIDAREDLDDCVYIIVREPMYMADDIRPRELDNYKLCIDMMPTEQELLRAIRETTSIDTLLKGQPNTEENIINALSKDSTADGMYAFICREIRDVEPKYKHTLDAALAVYMKHGKELWQMKMKMDHPECDDHSYLGMFLTRLDKPNPINDYMTRANMYENIKDTTEPMKQYKCSMKEMQDTFEAIQWQRNHFKQLLNHTDKETSETALDEEEDGHFPWKMLKGVKIRTISK